MGKVQVFQGMDGAIQYGSHVWLFTFTFRLTTIQCNSALSSLATLAAFRMLTRHTCLVATILDDKVYRASPPRQKVLLGSAGLDQHN